MLFNLDIATLVSRIIILIIAFSVHEFAHAWSANRFGDDTPRINGRLTLNPLAHLDPIGSLLLLVSGFGWAKPVPINPYALNRRSSAATMLVSLAGPMSNFMLAGLAAIPLRLGVVSFSGYREIVPTISQFLLEFIFINLSLMLFNLIPIAPLDGDHIAEFFFPPPLANMVAKIRPYGPLVLMLLLFVLPAVGIDLLGMILAPAANALFSLLVGV